MAREKVSRRKHHVTAYRDDIFALDGAVVYFVGTSANALVKVGRSTEFRTRFMRMASQSPVPLQVYGLLLFDEDHQARKAEKAIHTMLTHAGRHSHGEWFRIPMESVTKLAKHFA